MPIQLLPPQLANQIAAGEVVERPASVLKELLENCLDAGARKIVIELERGGIGLVRIRDDGAGIPKDELPLALMRHATSKIRDFHDLDAILSLGFRGEALASIASVSELILSANTAGQGSGWQAIASGRQMTVTVEPCAHPVGTTVTVRELFGNVPARRRFLKSEQTELAHCEDVVRRIALARPDIAIELSHNGKSLRRYRADSPEARLAAACGADFGRAARFFEREVDGLKLWGWLSGAEFHRSATDVQHVFVNGRAVRDRVLSHALRQAYDGRIPEGRHPAYVLYFELDPGAVDVNVHPTKHEVRFREPRRVHDFLTQAVAQALQERVQDASSAPLTLAPLPAAEAAAPLWPSHELARPLRNAPASGSAGALRASAPRYSPPSYSAAPLPRLLQEPVKNALHCLGVAQERFLLIDSPEGLWLAEALTVRRSVLAEQLAEQLAEGALAGRPLLLPLRLDLSEQEKAALLRHGALLEALGFRWLLAGGAVALRQQPASLTGVDWVVSLPALLLALDQRPPAEALAQCAGVAGADWPALTARLSISRLKTLPARRLDSEALAELLS